MSFESRLRRLEDRAELDDLVVRYFLASDNDDLDGVGDSFVPDATFSTSGAIAGSGRDGIVDFIRGARVHMGLTVHTPNYTQFSFIDDNHATGLVGAHLELVLGGVSVFGAVRYLDTYCRTEAGWRIVTRDMRTIHLAPWLDVGEVFASGTPVRWPGAEPAPSDFPRLRS